MRGIWRLRRWARRVAPGTLILLYHRVADTEQDPQLLCVTPEHFAEHLEVLRQHYHPLSLRNLQCRPVLNLWPFRGVVLTFDDGYADNLHQARPLLEAADVPATVFVVAGGVGSDRAFWWDELEHIFLSTSNLPDRLALKIDGQAYTWDLGEGEKDQHASGDWHILLDTQPTPRQAAYRRLTTLLRGLTESAREALLEELSAWSSVERNGPPDRRALTTEELQDLARGGLVEIGAHSMSHPVLPALPIQAQRAEIAESKKRLEDILDRPVVGFSYPFGGRNDYTAETVRLVQEAGFDYACSRLQGLVRWRTDLYQLPRFQVCNWDGEEFACHLEGRFGG